MPMYLLHDKPIERSIYRCEVTFVIMYFALNYLLTTITLFVWGYS